jgi:hypothetical protein
MGTAAISSAKAKLLGLQMIMARSFRSIRDNVGMVAQLPCWTSIGSDCSRQFLSNPEISDRAAADRYGWRDNGATAADVGHAGLGRMPASVVQRAGTNVPD